MQRQNSAKAVVEMKPDPAELTRRIRLAASVSRNVSFTDHALQRMMERSITDLDALKVLARGDIDGPIEPGRTPGEWVCKVIYRLKGNRDAGVVTAVLRNGRLFVKTVEWEDL